MPSIGEIAARVLKQVRPEKSEIERTLQLFNQIKKFIEDKYKVPARLMGSVARGTDLRGDKDIDVFIFFDPSTPRQTLEKRALEIGKAVFKRFRGKFVIEYAEHPYTKGHIEEFDIEIVPAYEVKDASAMMSAVDRTPFHNDYVNSHLSASQRDQVRLLKRFLYGVGCYGSDLKTQGFSGYLCELLVIRYGSFEGVLRAMQSWDFQQFVDIEKLHDTIEHARLRKRFVGQPLIFIDPVDKDRNVAAVVSREKLARAIFAARRFLAAPSMEFFFPKPARFDKKKIMANLKVRNTEVRALIFTRPRVVEDVLYPQLRRFERAVVKALREEGFQILDSWAFGDKECGLGLEVLSTQLPTFKVVHGPPVFSPPSHQDAFVKKYKKVWFVDDRLVAEVERKQTTLISFLSSWLRGSSKALQLKGVPSEIAAAVSKGFKVTDKIASIRAEEFWRGLEKERIK